MGERRQVRCIIRRRMSVLVAEMGILDNKQREICSIYMLVKRGRVWYNITECLCIFRYT